MRPITPTPRGMALVMAMIVIVLITMLVAGAISFTGTELAASEVQTQESSMSACIQASRNLFLSRLQLSQGDTPCPAGMGATECLNVSFDETLRNFNDPLHSAMLKTGHLGDSPTDPASVSGRRANTLTDPLQGQNDGTSVTKTSQGTRYYIVTAVCRESDAPGAPEREIEFMVRVDI